MMEKVEMTRRVRDFRLQDSEDYKASNNTVRLRRILYGYNICILVIGCATLGVAVWLLATDFGAHKVTTIVENELFEVTMYLLIAGGGILALLAFSGCYGTIREDKYVLIFYGTASAILLLVFVAASGLVFSFRGVLGTHIAKHMRDTLTEQYGMNVRTDPENRRITDAWDAMQRQFGCCGISGNSSSTDSWAYYSTNTLWYNENMKKASRKQNVPVSCCKSGNEGICTGQVYFPGPPNHINNPQEKYSKTNPYLYTRGCYDQLLNYLKVYSTVAGIVSATVALFLLVGIILSYCLYARVSGT